MQHKIKKVWAREILDSRGNPTVEVDLWLSASSADAFGRAAVPSGASTGTHEAVELRDGSTPLATSEDKKRYGGKGVLKAVLNVNKEIAEEIGGKEFDQKSLDEALIKLDGTENKGRLGANAILAVSLAFAKAAASSEGKHLFEYVRELSKNPKPLSLPLPLCNIINGGKHAAGSTDIQEFMIAPVGAPTFKEGLRMVAEIFHSLSKVLKDAGYGTTVGDEGGFAPAVKGGNKEALELISKATEKAGYKVGSDIVFALDVASSELREDGKYKLNTENKTLSSEEIIEFYKNLQKEFPVVSIEDGLGEDDWGGWKKQTEEMQNTQLVGDDLLVTNVKFLERGINEKAGNAILVKVNQIGSLTETVAAVDMAHEAGWNAIISHRSGETEDTTISHIVVGLGTGQIKTGSVSRTDRTAKYNELLRIEEILGERAVFSRDVFNK
jgi:enolase